MNKFNKCRELAERAHKDPFCFVGHVIWYVAIAYGLWAHSPLWIILSFVISGLFCLPSLLGFDTTGLIKIWIRSYFNRVGIILHIIGWPLAVYGLWFHNWTVLILAIIVMLIANIHAGLRERSNEIMRKLLRQQDK